MKNNMGTTDKLIRLIIAVIIIIAFYMGIFNETTGVIALVIAFVLTLTSLIGFCPLYSIFRFKTNKKID